jgi:uncharacterized membrane protein
VVKWLKGVATDRRGNLAAACALGRTGVAIGAVVQQSCYFFRKFQLLQSEYPIHVFVSFKKNV